jgi:hypothetical protein
MRIELLRIDHQNNRERKQKYSITSIIAKSMKTQTKTIIK